MSESKELKACPMCGKSVAVLTTWSEAYPDDPDEGNEESYAVVCDASHPNGPGGCGTSGGYKVTEADAIAAWNTRYPTQLLNTEITPDYENRLANLTISENTLRFMDQALNSSVSELDEPPDAEFLVELEAMLDRNETVPEMQSDDVQANEGPDFEDGPDEDGFKGPRPWNGFANTATPAHNAGNATQAIAVEAARNQALEDCRQLCITEEEKLREMAEWMAVAACSTLAAKIKDIQAAAPSQGAKQ